MVGLAVPIGVAVVSLALCFYLYRRYLAFKFFKHEGICGPEPHWLLGNIAEFASQKTRHLVFPKWTKKYGKLYGYYEGTLPVLVSSDPSFVSQVFIKQFPSFHGRKIFPLQDDPDTTKETIHVLLARGERWKRLRTIVNPIFSAGRLRSLHPLMTKCQTDFMNLLERKLLITDNGGFDIFPCFAMLTLDTISETAFGIELNCSKTAGREANPLYDSMSRLLRLLGNPSLLFQLAIIFPEFRGIFLVLDNIKSAALRTANKPRASDQLKKLIRDIIDIRKAGGEAAKRQDLLQMMLDLEDSQTTDPALLSGHKGLSTEEVIGQAIIFMIAGFDTTSNTLAFISYLLATHPDVQDKLMAEIEEHFAANDSKKTVDYNSVHELPYLNAVINETLRVYPVTTLVVNRLCMDDSVIDGVRIPKGVVVQADVWSLHHDEEQWGPVDPTKFHPERFLADYPTTATRKEGAFLPFGIGPRICAGMRFAQLEIKITLVNLLRKYRIVKTAKTGDELALMSNVGITPANGVWVKLVPQRQ